MTHQPPPGVSPQSWDDAFRRVDACLASLGAGRAFLRTSITRGIMDRVASRLTEHPGLVPIQEAMSDLETETLEWVQRVLGSERLPADGAYWECRLGLLLSGLAARWPEVLLSEPPWPEEFVAAIREGFFEGVPASRRGQMKEQQLALGSIPGMADVTLRRLDRTRWLRIGLLWATFIAASVLFFHFTR